MSRKGALRFLAMVTCAAAALGGGSSCGVEPIPSIETPEPYVVSSLPADSGPVAVIGQPLLAPGGSVLRVRNRRTTEVVDITAGGNGGWTTVLDARVGDEIEVRFLEGSQEGPPRIRRVVNAEETPELPPPNAGAIEVSKPVKDTVQVRGSAGAVAPGTLVVVGNPNRSVSSTEVADGTGSFTLMIPADNDDRLSVVAASEEGASPLTEVVVPPAEPSDTDTSSGEGGGGQDADDDGDDDDDAKEDDDDDDAKEDDDDDDDAIEDDDDDDDDDDAVIEDDDDDDDDAVIEDDDDGPGDDDNRGPGGGGGGGGGDDPRGDADDGPNVDGPDDDAADDDGPDDDPDDDLDDDLDDDDATGP
jgi:hypothetical protein